MGIDEKGNKVLHLEPIKVKQEAASTFKKQFRKRIHGFDTMSTEWHKVYEQTGKHKQAFEGIDATPTREEWEETVKAMNKDSAAGPSGLGYIFYKKLPDRP
jgi:hypothetical protein